MVPCDLWLPNSTVLIPTRCCRIWAMSFFIMTVTTLHRRPCSFVSVTTEGEYHNAFWFSSSERTSCRDYHWWPQAHTWVDGYNVRPAFYVFYSMLSISWLVTRTEAPFKARITGTLALANASISFPKSLRAVWNNLVIGHVDVKATYGVVPQDDEYVDNVLLTPTSDHMQVIFLNLSHHTAQLAPPKKIECRILFRLCLKKNRFLLNYRWKKLPSVQDMSIILA